MKLIQFLFGLVVVLLVILVAAGIAGYLLPRTFEVEKSTRIAAPEEVVFAYVGDLKSWPRWTVWGDYGLDYVYSTPSSGEGAWMAWSDPEGDARQSGRLTFTAFEPEDSVAFTLEMGDLTEGPATGELMLEEDDGLTTVTWTFAGAVPKSFASGWLALIFESSSESAYTQSLARLKEIAESAAEALPQPEAIEESLPEEPAAETVEPVDEIPAEAAGEVPLPEAA